MKTKVTQSTPEVILIEGDKRGNPLIHNQETNTYLIFKDTGSLLELARALLDYYKKKE